MASEPRQPELKDPSQTPDRTLLYQLDRTSLQSFLRKSIWEMPAVTFRGVGHLGIPAGFLLEPTDHLSIPLGSGLGSQRPMATDNGSFSHTATPNIQQ